MQIITFDELIKCKKGTLFSVYEVTDKANEYLLDKSILILSDVYYKEDGSIHEFYYNTLAFTEDNFYCVELDVNTTNRFGIYGDYNNFKNYKFVMYEKDDVLNIIEVLNKSLTEGYTNE